ncbi:DNA polymerase [Limnobacter sp.]|uniref:DNA polymerase n=1 Tax=Limnobacter sp. TaxID=2003368 RepID=UPI0025C00C27|nr:DNA polymerase [Limnobacter sp.]
MTYDIYYGVEHLDKLQTATEIAFDTETLQLQPEAGKLRLLQFGSEVRKTIVIVDLFKTDDDEWSKIDTFFENGDRNWIAHNAVFDLGWLQACGFKLYGRAYCTMIASKLLNNGIPNLKHGLVHLAKRYLELDISKEEQTSDWSAPDLSESQLAYAAKDVEVLLQLQALLPGMIASAGLDPAYALECRALPVMAHMWRTGLPWNRSSLEQLREDYEHDIAALGKDFLFELDTALPDEHKLPRETSQRLDYLKKKVTEMGHDDEDYEKWYSEIESLETQPTVFNLRAKDQGSIRLGTKKYKGFNINSPKQLLGKFTALLGKEPVDNKTGKPSASRAALQEYAADHHVVQTYLAWKRAEKRRQMVDSILERLDSDGYVRASYLQLGAESGRMSCIKPNNQQIPRDKDFRRCVEAPEGWLLVDADFGQMELRLAAAVAKDEKMIQAFQEGQDLHTVTAEAIGCTRQIAKSANFGLLYGSGANGLRNYAASSGVTMTLEEAKEIRQQWLDTYQGIARWQRENAEAAEKTEGFKWAAIRIPHSNMRRYLPGDMNRLTVRCNTPIQGAGAAILKCALGSLWPELVKVGELEAKIAACVHDEILLLVVEDKAQEWAAKLKKIMESAEAEWLGDVPPLAEPAVGKRWSEIH